MSSSPVHTRLMRNIEEIIKILTEEKVLGPYNKASTFYKVHLTHDVWEKNLEKVFQKYLDIEEYSRTFPDIKQFIFCVRSNLTEVPRCPICGDPLKFETNGGQYYRDTCCKMSCQNEWKRQGYLERHGVENPSQLKWVQEKKEQTCLKNFGVKHPSESKKVVEKQKASWLSHKEENLDRRKKIMLERYGVENMSQVPEFQRKKAWKYYYNRERFDSKPELAYYIYLKDNNIPFSFHTDRLEYFEENKKHYYYPDFKVKGRYVEIKSPVFFNEKKEPWDPYNKKFWWGKYNCMRDHNVSILMDKEYEQYLDYIEEKYGKYYLDQFKIDPQSKKE